VIFIVFVFELASCTGEYCIFISYEYLLCFAFRAVVYGMMVLVLMPVYPHVHSFCLLKYSCIMSLACVFVSPSGIGMFSFFMRLSCLSVGSLLLSMSFCIVSFASLRFWQVIRMLIIINFHLTLFSIGRLGRCHG
jgi:hypothetical protein